MLRRRLLAEAMTSGGKCTRDFFVMYGGEIADTETLKGNKSVVERLFTPLLRDHNVPGLRWLKDVLSTNTDSYESWGDVASVEDFKQRLHGDLQSLSVTGDEEVDDVGQLVIDISAILGIEVIDRSTAEHEASEDESLEQ